MASNQPITIALPMDGLKPGSVMVMGTATANNMMNFEYMLDFGLEKQSLPPTVSLKISFDGKNATWDASGLQFTLKGTVSDLMERLLVWHYSCVALVQRISLGWN